MISILCPTRKRPNDFRLMVESARATANAANIQICCYFDLDDKNTARCAVAIGASHLVGLRATLSNCWNECLKVAKGDIFMLATDDLLFKTPGWDKLVEDEFAKSKDKIVLVQGNDRRHPFVHRNWIEALGFFVPPYFSSGYADTWLRELADTLKRIKTISLEIYHPPHLLDETKSDRLWRQTVDSAAEFYNTLAPLRELDLWKLRRRIKRMENQEIKWSILILTQPSRQQFLARLLAILKPQIEAMPDVELKIRIFDPNIDLGRNRQILVEEAAGQYCNFVDDDDEVDDDYVATIHPLLDGVDMVGFQLQCYMDDVQQKPTYHSLKYGGWNADQEGFYRDISHLNPMRRALMQKVPFEGGHGEDSRWADKMRGLGIVKTEHYVDEIMYHYYFRSKKEDSAVSRAAPPPITTTRGGFQPHIHDAGRPQKRFVTAGSATCPKCGSTSVAYAGGMRHCNQCGCDFSH